MKISVIIPVYNNERYVSRCVNSVLNQSYRDIEVLIIDDGSTDSSGKICDELSLNDSRIRVVHKKNQGVSIARNTGLELAKGELITFVDSDDWIEKELFEKVVSCFEKYKNIDAVSFGSTMRYDNKSSKVYGKIDTSRQMNNLDSIVNINYNKGLIAAVWQFVYKRGVIENVRFPQNVIIGEDYSFNIKALLNAKSIYSLDFIGYNYFQRVDSVSYKGYQGKSKKIMENYETTMLLQKYDKKLYRSAEAYYVLQIMAVVISMVKSDKYNRDIIAIAQRKVREHFLSYITNINVEFYKKCCAILLIINYRLLTVPYRMLFKKKRGI